MSMDIAQANKAIKHGVIAGCIVGGITVLITALAMASGASGQDNELAYWNDPLMVVDIVLIFALVYGMYKKSRLAAVVMVLYFIGSKVMVSLESGAYTGGIVSLIIVYYFIKATMGTFVYHRIEKAENPDYKGSGKVFYFIAIPGVSILLLMLVFGSILLLMLVFGIMATSTIIPNTCVVAGERVPEAIIEQLIAENVIYPEESILYYYSWGVFSHMEGGSVLTDNYVITYEKDEAGVVQIYELPIAEITKIETLVPGSYIEDSIHKIHGTGEESWIAIQLSVEAGGDQTFLSELSRRSRQIIRVCFLEKGTGSCCGSQDHAPAMTAIPLPAPSVARVNSKVQIRGQYNRECWTIPVPPCGNRPVFTQSRSPLSSSPPS
jgi:hypothetical protein